MLDISIHPPLAGRDSNLGSMLSSMNYFNPPAPCGAGREDRKQKDNHRNFNPPAPCGAGRCRLRCLHPEAHFNPPAPCGAGHLGRRPGGPHPHFNPPAPCGAGPPQRAQNLRCRHFNPPAPCGAGLFFILMISFQVVFQSTRPLRGGTPAAAPIPQRSGISIHPPLAGRDFVEFADFTMESPFQSTRPLRGGTGKNPVLPALGPFQSTRPLRGGTAILHKKTVQNIAYCTKSAFTLAVLSGFLALMRPFFCQTCTNFGANLPKNRCSLPVRTLIPSGPPPADSRH